MFELRNKKHFTAENKTIWGRKQKKIAKKSKIPKRPLVPSAEESF